MEIKVYCHEIVSGSDVGMHFSASLELSVAAAGEYRRAFRVLDPGGSPLGSLAIYEMVLQLPDFATMIDLLNSPQSLLYTCLKNRRIVAFSQD
ncbi:hypothetical protein [Rhizobium bangladeshense]|uniref:hypothetical protein n=1 Tax=Rhizobium bangladeshense TaxID=1138189 RepID=UPI0007E58903|nr:hypothetical protein [Rhizobium bangladeshense]